MVVQASTGYCILYRCPSMCTTCGCHSTKATHKCEGVGNGKDCTKPKGVATKVLTETRHAHCCMYCCSASRATLDHYVCCLSY